jgi:hypothetical protein
MNDSFFLLNCFSAIQNFAEESTVQSGSKLIALYESLGVFAWTFGLSFLIGALMGKAFETLRIIGNNKNEYFANPLFA